MSTTSRLSRIVGSAVFLLAGLAYIVVPPVTTTRFLESWWPAAAWGVVFALGGIVSTLGVVMRFVQIERFGVLLVVIASTCLTSVQALVMLDGPTWTRLGGTLVYAGFTIWSFERWHRLEADERAIRELAGGESGTA